MAEETRIVGIYEIKIEQGPTLRAFEEVKKKLDNTRASIRDLNKENKELIAAEKQVEAAVKASGAATTAQAKQLEAVRNRRDALNKELSEAVIVEKALSAQSRELTNDLGKLTENGLRFRDKMAQATLEAIKQSGVIEQLNSREQELTKSLTRVNSTLESSETQLAQLNLAYSKNEKSADDYAKEQEQLNRQIEAGKAAQTLLSDELTKVTGKTDILEKQVHELNQELNAGKISAEQYRQGLTKIEEETRKAGAATSTLTDRFDSFVSGQGKELKSTLSSVALNYVGVGAAIYGVQNIIGGAVDTVVQFDKALSGIRALGGEYADNINEIGEAAKTAGINFGFTATESLNAVEALAKAGVSTADILGGGLTGALTLAAAGEISVADAAETASKAMTQFGLSGEQIPHLADLLAAAAATATGDVGDFNAALNQSGLVMSQLNIPIEEGIGALTAFASAGLLGSDAGTSFRTMLLRLQNPTEESAALLEKYNIDAFDLQGNFVGIENLAGQLQDRLSGLTQEQRSAALAQIFGSDAIRAANVLYTQGSEGIANYNEQVNQSGFAATVAAEKTNNLAGDLDKAKAQYDAFVLSIESGGGRISTALRGITQGLADILGYLTEINREGDILGRVGAASGKALEVETDIAAFRDEVNKYLEANAQLAQSENTDRILGNAQSTLRVAIEQRQGDVAALTQLAGKLGQAVLESEKGTLQYAKAAVGLEQVKKAIAEAEKALVAEQEKSNAAVTEGTEVVVKDTAAKSDNAEKTANVTGSVADLNDQISKLREQQSQTTTSEQFSTYEQQIAGLTEQVDVLTGKIAAVPDLKSIDFGPTGDTDAPAPTTPNVDELAVLGINPNAKELVGQEMSDIQAIIDEANLTRLESSTNLNDQLLAIEIQWSNGSLTTYQEYQAKRAEIAKQIEEQERAAATASGEIAQGAFNVLQDISDASFDRKIADLDEQTSTLQDKLKNATTEEQRRSIEAQIKETETKKKQLEEQKKSQQIFAVAAALIATYQSAQAAYLSQLTIPTPDAPIRAAAAAAVATAVGLLNVAKIQGLAEGGPVEPSGRVTSGWGTPVNRSNGDNVLVRAGKSFVTLKTGEVVLNEGQQEEAKRKFGPDVFAQIGVPGFGGKTMARHYLDMGYADGGTVGIVTPRPSPTMIVQSQLVSELATYSDRPINASIVEIRDVNTRVDVIEQARAI